MDPRHPELVLPRIKELVKQYDRIVADFEKATSLSQLAPLEMEGVNVVKELCLTAPRLHDFVIKFSRDSRQRIMTTPVKQPQQEAVIVEPKPKKKPAKKKTAKKGKK